MTSYPLTSLSTTDHRSAPMLNEPDERPSGRGSIRVFDSLSKCLTLFGALRANAALAPGAAVFTLCSARGAHPAFAHVINKNVTEEDPSICAARNASSTGLASSFHS